MITRGSHSLRFGAALEHTDAGFPETLFPNGIWTYNGFFTGSGMGDYLLGLPRNILTFSPFYPTLRHNMIGGWVADNWKVNSKLNISLGFRLDADSRWTDKYNRLVNYDLSAPPTAVRVLSASLPAGWNKTLLDTPAIDPAGRVGLAYQLRRGTVIRGGFGMFYQPIPQDPPVNLAVNAPYVAIANETFDFTTLPTFNRSNPLANAAVAGIGAEGLTRNYADSYTEQWNLTVEQAFGPNNLLSVAYVGDTGMHLVTEYGADPAPPGPGPIQPRARFTNISSYTYWDTDRDSSFNGLQVKMERRASKNLTATVAYGYGKSIDDGSGTYVESYPDSFQDPSNPKASRGLSNFNVGQSLTFSYSYLLPLGAGQKLASGATGAAGKLVSGWELSGLTTVHGGFPYSANLPYDNLNDGVSASFPNRTCNPNNFAHANRSAEVAEWFNTACFADPPQYVYGNAGRDTIIAPGVVNWDFSLFKKTNITERVGVEFRAEFFNLFNRPDFGQPNTTLGPGFGVITSVSQAAREIQFGLKFSF